MAEPAKPLNKLYHSFSTFDLRTIKYGTIKQAVKLSCAHAKAHLPFDQMKIVEAPKVCYGHFYNILLTFIFI